MHLLFTGQSVVCRGSGNLAMSACDHEEADSRICIHVQDAVRNGASKVLVRTVDTDVIVILVGIYFQLCEVYQDCEIWVGFGTGKHYKCYSINSICLHLGKRRSRALPFFHSFTGSDTTSQFLGRGKKSAWESWRIYPEVTDAFLCAVDRPFKMLELNSRVTDLLERYTCVLYDKTTPTSHVNELRRDLFCKKAKTMENIPPTQVFTLLLSDPPINL